MTHVSRNKLIRGENVLFITKPSFCVILRCFCWTRAGTQSVFVCPKQKTCKISRVPQVTHVTIHIYLPFTYVRRPSISVTKYYLQTHSPLLRHNHKKFHKQKVFKRKHSQEFSLSNKRVLCLCSHIAYLENVCTVWLWQ